MPGSPDLLPFTLAILERNPINIIPDTHGVTIPRNINVGPDDPCYLKGNR